MFDDQFSNDGASLSTEGVSPFQDPSSRCSMDKRLYIYASRTSERQAHGWVANDREWDVCKEEKQENIL